MGSGHGHMAPLSSDALAELVDSVRPYTMVPGDSLRDLVRKVEAVVEAGVPGDLVECGTWRGGRVLPFLERDGQYWGPPRDSAAVLDQIAHARQRGYAFVVLLWDDFWWLDSYHGLDSALRSTYRVVAEDRN